MNLRKLFLMLVMMISFVISSICFAAPTETISGAYIGMTKAELLTLPGYQNGASATVENGTYHIREVVDGVSNGYTSKTDFMSFDQGTCFVYFKDNKIITIHLMRTFGNGSRKPLKHLDNSGLNVDANWVDFRDSSITKEYPNYYGYTWLKLQDDTYLNFNGAFGRMLDRQDLKISGIYLSKYLDPYSTEEKKIEEKQTEEKTKKEVPVEKKIANAAFKIFGL